MAPQKFTAEEVRALYERHGPALAAHACCCGLDFASAEDVVQQKLCADAQMGIPSPQRINEERAEVGVTRESLLQLLQGK